MSQLYEEADEKEGFEVAHSLNDKQRCQLCIGAVRKVLFSDLFVIPEVPPFDALRVNRTIRNPGFSWRAGFRLEAGMTNSEQPQRASMRSG